MQRKEVRWKQEAPLQGCLKWSWARKDREDCKNFVGILNIFHSFPEDSSNFNIFWNGKLAWPQSFSSSCFFLWPCFCTPCIILGIKISSFSTTSTVLPLNSHWNFQENFLLALPGAHTELFEFCWNCPLFHMLCTHPWEFWVCFHDCSLNNSTHTLLEFGSHVGTYVQSRKHSDQPGEASSLPAVFSMCPMQGIRPCQAHKCREAFWTKIFWDMKASCILEVLHVLQSFCGDVKLGEGCWTLHGWDPKG